MGKVSAASRRGSRRALLLARLSLAASALLAFAGGAVAQDAIPDCAPAIGRLVSLQGSVELQRAGASAWHAVKRLDVAICAGDRLRTDAQSRAGLFVEPETMVRVDQNTVIRLNQATDAIEVEFFLSELAAKGANAPCCGAGYFITRFPKKFKVVTPHMNAAVEGTEFMVQLNSDATKLTVLEGKVASQSVATGDTRLVAAGQSVQTGPGGDGTIATVVKPQDAVQWVLRYPPISDGGSTTRAEALLRAGSVDEALAAIGEALRTNPSDDEALALQSVIQIAKNDKAAALDSAARATAVNGGNFRAWLALSYAQQAAFDLDAALVSARRAESLESRSALAHARVAELLLSRGDTRAAMAAARAAVASNPAESHAHSMLGFVHLAQIDTKAARAEFQAAIERDSFSALPRLGIGLAMIREGALQPGREQVEIAVALDPLNSLLRSYVGKAYYEENSKARDELAATQFGQASELDPRDPTPWFYKAILEDSRSRPAAALADLKRSAELNQDRAVYRSRQLLDQDLAARAASQASVYNELGFHQLGINEAAGSLAIDPGSGSAHRFLADMNSTLPRYGIARASELLQSQLRQPLGAPPLQAQLANDVLFRSAFFGSETVGLNEFNPLFVRDGLQTQVFGLLGSNDTWGDQVILSGLNGAFSFGLSQFAAETDGYRVNDDDRIRQYDGIVQWQPLAGSSLQFEVTDWTRDSGDLVSAFDPAFNSDTLRNHEEVKTQRFGLRQVIDASSDLLVSVIHQDRRASIRFPDPVAPVTVAGEQDSWKTEAQYLLSHEDFDVIVGASYFGADSKEQFIVPPDQFDTSGTPSHLNAYGYLLYAASPGLPAIQVGLTYDELESEVGTQSEWNPKFGMIWRFSERVALRAAAFRTLKRRINSDQGLEPTQVAGFNQLFDDLNGTVSDAGAFALDITPSAELHAGIQFSRRKLKTPFDFGGSVIVEHEREDTISAYGYWLPANRWSASVEARYQDFENGPLFETLELLELPIAVKYASPSGLRAGLTVTGVDEDGTFVGPGGVLAPGSDRFWLVDAFLAYRLPSRSGTVSLEATNILGEKFRFQEPSQEAIARYVPESQYFLRVSIGF
jgi:tetratricopeptide (TPR) repeat protein